MTESELHDFTPIGFLSDDGVAFVDRCQVVDVDGQPVRVHGDLRTPEDHAAFAEVVRAARRRFVDGTPGLADLQERLARLRLLWLRARLGPAPLPIDGHAYHRRTRNRKGRRR